MYEIFVNYHFLFYESNSFTILSLPNEITADFIKQNVQYKCIPNNTKAIVSKYKYYQWIIYH